MLLYQINTYNINNTCMKILTPASASGGLCPQIPYRGSAPEPRWGTSVRLLSPDTYVVQFYKILFKKPPKLVITFYWFRYQMIRVRRRTRARRTVSSWWWIARPMTSPVTWWRGTRTAVSWWRTSVTCWRRMAPYWQCVTWDRRTVDVTSVGLLTDRLETSFVDTPSSSLKEVADPPDNYYYYNLRQEVLRSVVFVGAFVCVFVISVAWGRRRDKRGALAQRASGVAGARERWDVRTNVLRECHIYTSRRVHGGWVRSTGGG